MSGLDFLCTVKLISVLMKIRFIIDLFKNQFKSSGYSIQIFGLFVCLLLLKIKEGDGHREAQINSEHLTLCSVLGKQLSGVWPVGSGLPG